MSTIAIAYLKAILNGNKRDIYSQPEIYDAMVNGLLGREHLAIGVADVIQDNIHYADQPILDLAAGSGVLSLELAKRGLNVTAADLDPLALNSIELKTHERSLPKISTLQLDFNTPIWPIEQTSFQLVTSLRANRYISDFTQWLGNVHRILQSDGLLVLPIFSLDTVAWKMNSDKGMRQETKVSRIVEVIESNGFKALSAQTLPYQSAIHNEHKNNSVPFFYKPTFIVANKQ